MGVTQHPKLLNKGRPMRANVVLFPESCIIWTITRLSIAADCEKALQPDQRFLSRAFCILGVIIYNPLQNLRLLTAHCAKPLPNIVTEIPRKYEQ
jgi:hypothetical protein